MTTPVTPSVSPVAAHDRPAATRKVRAIKVGYYDRLQQPGDEFLIQPPNKAEREDGTVITIDLFSKNWMEEVDEKKERAEAKAEAKAEAAAEKAAEKAEHHAPTGARRVLG